METLLHERHRITEIEKDYSFNKLSKEELLRFLANKNSLSIIPVFHDIAQYIQQEFDNNVKLELKVVADPENHNFEEIFIYLHSSLSNEEISAKHDKVLSWYVKSIHRNIPPIVNISPVFN